MGGGLVAAPGVLAACGGGEGGGSGKRTIVFVSYGGAYQAAQTKAWIEPFMRAHPDIEVVQDGPTDYAKLQAMVQAGAVTWDVVDVGSDFGLKKQAELLEAIDCSIVTCGGTIKGLQNTKWRVAEQTGSYHIAYRTDKLPSGRAPRGWSDFYDVRGLPGKRAHWQSVSGGVLESALLADGVAPGALYPLDVDRALKKLDTIKDDVVWWETGAQAGQFLQSGEVAMAGVWTGRALDAKEQGAPVALQWNQHLQYGEYLVVPKGTRHRKEAMQLVAWMTSARRNAQIARHYEVAPATREAVDDVDPARAKDLPTGHRSQAVFFDDRWWGENYDAINERFQAWLKS